MKEMLRMHAQQLGTHGYRIIADRRHSVYKKISRTMVNEINGIVGVAVFYKNSLGELAIDYDMSV